MLLVAKKGRVSATGFGVRPCLLRARRPGYLAYFDFDSNGRIDNADFNQFKQRLGKSI